MKGYGPAQRFTPSHRGRRRHLIAGALAGLTMLAVSGCSLLEETSREPGALNLPATNAPSTETVPSTLPPTATDQTTTSRTYSVPEDDTFRQVITDAPAVGVGAFHIGATTATGERMDDVSGVHFSTPDRSYRCSTGNNGANALACVGDKIRGREAAPANAPAGCAWEKNLAVLSSTGSSAGACSNLYPVLYRSHILEFGSAIRAGSFSCLNDVSGLYCLDSGSEDGFALTRSGYQRITGDDRAPDSLLKGGGSGSNSTHTSQASSTPSR